MYKEEDYLMLSGIQHFCFCRRQWALIHIEQQWDENLKTTEGALLHKNAHDESKIEKRGDVIIIRGLRIKSNELGITGNCDVVEFQKDDEGISLNKYSGSWKPYPIEYKNGKPKEDASDVLQLCGQAMCLEEMLSCEIPKGALFYGKINRRIEVEFTEDLRNLVRNMFAEMHSYWEKGWTPKGRATKACNACSLINICLPKLGEKKTVKDYIGGVLMEDENIT